LADDRAQGAAAEFRVIGHWNGDGKALNHLRHHHVAAALAYLLESMGSQYPADLLPGKHRQFLGNSGIPSASPIQSATNRTNGGEFT
jgi:hypothetical protein